MTTYRIDTIVNNSIVNTEVTNSVDQAIHYLWRAQQSCLNAIAKVYEIDKAGNRRELKW